MKKIIVFILLLVVHFGSKAQIVTTLTLHNSCVTAVKVCNWGRIMTPEINDKSECEGALVPQYFKFDMTGVGSIELNTFGHTGTYTLYGPMASLGLTSCQQISLGQVNQVSASLSSTNSIAHAEGFYVLRVLPTNCISNNDGYLVDIDVSSRNSNCEPRETECIDCISSFSPGPGEYLVSAWAKQIASDENVGYDSPSIKVSFIGAPDNFTFQPSGKVIDGWQRIDGIVTVPFGATDISVGLYCESGTCLFDDIRFIPMQGSMISYVYDPVTLKMVAELDERNYATLFEYDEEGALIRTKKETEKGILTITEGRTNLRK